MAQPEARRPTSRGGAAVPPPRPPADDTADLLPISERLTEGRRRMRLSRLTRWALVVPLLVLWIVFWLLPVVPGFQFLLVALFLMAPDIPAFRRLATRLQRKFPKIRRKIPKRWRITKDHGR